MLLRKCAVALSLTVALSGCSQMAVQMAKSNLGMNSVPPSFESYKPSVANDPEAKEFITILSASEQSFNPLKGKPYEAEKKQKIVDEYKKQKDTFVNSLLDVMTKIDAVKSFKDNLRFYEDSEYWYGTVQPAGSKEAVVSMVDSVNSTFQLATKSYSFFYDINSVEAGRIKMAELDKVIRRAIASHVSDWTINDKAKQDASSRSVIGSYNKMIELSGSRPDIITPEQADNYRDLIKAANKKIKQPVNYVSYSYNWESKFVNQIGGASMPKMNTLMIMVMNNMSDYDMQGKPRAIKKPKLTVSISTTIHLQ